MYARTLMTLVFALAFSLAFTTSSFADREVKIFNGKDLKGWTKRGGEATYAVEDGVIVGRSAPNTPNTFLCTDDDFGDFILELDFKIDEGDFNSGVQIRSRSNKKHQDGRVHGYQVEIDPLPRAYSGGIYFEGGSPEREAGWLQNLDGNDKARKAFKHGDWNHFKIVAKGRRIQTWINGVPAADYTDKDEKAFVPKGFIALQVHGVGDKKETKEVRWKDIKLTLLDSGKLK
jgi:hypothetical protein